MPLPSSYTFLADSFRLSLQAQNKSPKTIYAYMDAVRLLGEFLSERGHTCEPDRITRQDVESFIQHQLTKPHARTGKPMKPTTAHYRYRSLQAWFRWLIEEQEIARSPMEHMRPPALPDNPPPVLQIADLQKLLATCQGREPTFYDKRDAAILYLLIDCGLRRAEIGNLTVDDLDFTTDPPVVWVVGKGRKRRAVALGRQTALAVRRYLRARLTYPSRDATALWLGTHGPMTPWGIEHVVKSRAAQAGLEGVHPHLFRHSWAHLCLEAGATEAELKALGGWESDAMPRHYGRAAAGERARKAHRRFSPGDRLGGRGNHP